MCWVVNWPCSYKGFVCCNVSKLLVFKMVWLWMSQTKLVPIHCGSCVCMPFIVSVYCMSVWNLKSQWIYVPIHVCVDNQYQYNILQRSWMQCALIMTTLSQITQICPFAVSSHMHLSHIVLAGCFFHKWTFTKSITKLQSNYSSLYYTSDTEVPCIFLNIASQTWFEIFYL